jgi:hypothetical protein
MVSNMDRVTENDESTGREPPAGEERSPDEAYRAAVRRYARLSGRRR